VVGGRWSVVVGRWSSVGGRRSVVVGRWSSVGGRGGDSVQRWRPVPVQGVVQPGGEVDERAPGRCRIAVAGQNLGNVEHKREGESLVALGEPWIFTSRVVVHADSFRSASTIHRGARRFRLAGESVDNFREAPRRLERYDATN
jgi:hypothetical protein